MQRQRDDGPANQILGIHILDFQFPPVQIDSRRFGGIIHLNPLRQCATRRIHHDFTEGDTAGSGHGFHRIVWIPRRAGCRRRHHCPAFIPDTGVLRLGPCIFVVTDDVRLFALPYFAADESLFGILLRMRCGFQRPDVRLEGIPFVSDKGIRVAAAAACDITNILAGAKFPLRMPQHQEELAIIRQRHVRRDEIPMHCSILAGVGDVNPTRQTRFARRPPREQQNAVGRNAERRIRWKSHQRFVHFLAIDDDADAPVFERHRLRRNVPEFQPIVRASGTVAYLIENQRGAQNLRRFHGLRCLCRRKNHQG